ncbi:PAS domain S-box-containing protein/diguanylate cyclase (GGDEF) domain-containing protein [Streptomyces sp. Ncost-T6T-2b]|nr:PAS domain S-box-containing protein/diguanylate cyclase (GGDEF) domain-containing protein [Streptomyces sp. Ncost-T6T-2b]
MSGTSEGPRASAGTAPGAPAAPVTERHTTVPAESGPARTGPGGGDAGSIASELRDYRAAFNAATLPMGVVDGRGHVVRANEALGGLLGTPAAVLAGRQACELLDLATDDRTWHAYREVLLGRRSRFRCTRRLKHPDGRSLWAEITVVPMTGASAAESARVLLTVADVSDRRELQERLRHLQMHDPVTRLPNRTLFFERLASTLETPPYQDDSLPSRQHARIGLCYLDLDGFKAINDTLGHRTGDRLLAAVAARLTDCAENDASRNAGGSRLVARLGGDEFAILVEDSAGTQELTDLARSVLAALQQPFDLAGQRLSVSASIGVVERTAAGTSPTGLMQAADTTLYWAKADGRARWTLFDPERNAHRMTRQSLSSTLRPAVERGEFTLEYQPLVGMADGVRARGRGAGALEPPAVRRAAAESVRPDRRGGRVDRPARPVGAAHRVPAGAALAAGPPGRAAAVHQRQRRRTAGLGLRPGGRRGADPGRDRTRPRARSSWS